MAKPLIAVETIYGRALELLDGEGVAGITVRRLAADLKCSTRTLYEQVGTRDELIRQLVARHFATLRLEFREAADWQTTAMNWSRALRAALLAHPNLSRLMTFDDRAAIVGYVNRLYAHLTDAEVEQEPALRCCRVLLNTTISLTIAEIQARPMEGASRIDAWRAGTGDVFDATIRWIVLGVAADV